VISEEFIMVVHSREKKNVYSSKNQHKSEMVEERGKWFV